MAELNASEIEAVKSLLAARKKGNVRIVNGRPFDMGKVRAPIVSEDTKYSMYANPRLMLKERKPTYEEDPVNGVEYEWLLKGSYERLSRRAEYRPVLLSEVDFTSKFCKLDASKKTIDRVTGEAKEIVTSGEFELFETKGESAYLLKRYGADKALSEIKGKGSKDLQTEAVGSGLNLNTARHIESPEWEPSNIGNLGDPATWGGKGGKFV